MWIALAERDSWRVAAENIADASRLAIASVSHWEAVSALLRVHTYTSITSTLVHGRDVDLRKSCDQGLIFGLPDLQGIR